MQGTPSRRVPPPRRSAGQKTLGISKKKVVIFHSASIPQLIADDVETLTDYGNDNGVTLSKQAKNYKYQFYVLYYQPKWVHPAKDASKPKQQQYVIKHHKFVISKLNVKDLSNGADQVNSLTVKQMRTKGKDFVIGTTDFNRARVMKMGGFLNKRFWHANLLWGCTDNFLDNFSNTTAAVKKQIPIIHTTCTEDEDDATLKMDTTDTIAADVVVAP